MSANYELWASNDGATMLGVPNSGRAMVLHEPAAMLLLRFKAASWDEAKRIRDEYLYGGNPNKYSALNIPGTKFLFFRYRCGLCAGDKIVFKVDYDLVVGESHWIIEAGTRHAVIAGDTEAPHLIWMQLIDKPSGEYTVGQFEHLPDDDQIRAHVQYL